MKQPETGTKDVKRGSKSKCSGTWLINTGIVQRGFRDNSYKTRAAGRSTIFSDGKHGEGQGRERCENSGSKFWAKRGLWNSAQDFMRRSPLRGKEQGSTEKRG